MIKMDSGLKYWTVTEVAEYLSIGKELSAKLWGFYERVIGYTLPGGDGSEGRNLTPDGQLDESCDDKLSHWWKELSAEEQQCINEAYAKEHA